MPWKRVRVGVLDGCRHIERLALAWCGVTIGSAFFDPDSVRLGLERELMQRLTRELGDLSPATRDYEEVRREWLCVSEPLSARADERAQRLVRETRESLGVSRNIELFQEARPAHINAATHRADEGPILIKLDGDLLARIDDAGMVAILGHEVGHHLAHGPSSIGGVDPFFLFWRLARGRRAGYRELASAYCRAAELTADRIGLLACRNLEAAIRTESVIRGNAEHIDPSALLEAGRVYSEGLRTRRRRCVGDSHPEVAVRIYAMGLFAESDVYRAITGVGSGTRSLVDIDRMLADIVGPDLSAEDMGLPPEGDPRLLDRARDALAGIREDVPVKAVAALRRVLREIVTPTDHEDLSLELAELERDPLEDAFLALECEVDQRERALLEQRFVDLERAARSE